MAKFYQNQANRQSNSLDKKITIPSTEVTNCCNPNRGSSPIDDASQRDRWSIVEWSSKEFPDAWSKLRAIWVMSIYEEPINGKCVCVYIYTWKYLVMIIVSIIPQTWKHHIFFLYIWRIIYSFCWVSALHGSMVENLAPTWDKI